MGVVYEAVQESLGRHVALKVLPAASLAGPSHLERFRLEARAAARLHHTNIVPVFGVGESGGRALLRHAVHPGPGTRRRVRRAARGCAAPRLRREPRRAAPLRSRSSADAGRGPWAADGSVSRRRARRSSPRPARMPEVEPIAGCTEARHRGFSGDGVRFGGIGRLGRPRIIRSSPAPRPRRSTIERGADRRPGRRGAWPTPTAGDPAPRHQAVEPPARRQGNVWVTDFGLAKAEGSDDLTHTGDLVGTLRYMAPERFDGQSDRTERRLLAGVDPLRAADAAPALRGGEPGEADRAGHARRAGRRRGSSTATSRATWRRSS